MAKAKTKTYILLGDHIGIDGLLVAGSSIELTDEGAKNLVGKVALKSSLAKGGSDPKLLEAANKQVAALEGDVESLTGERDALAADLETVKAQNTEFRAALGIAEDEPAEGITAKLANWIKGKGKKDDGKNNT